MIGSLEGGITELADERPVGVFVSLFEVLVQLLLRCESKPTLSERKTAVVLFSVCHRIFHFFFALEAHFLWIFNDEVMLERHVLS